MNIKEAKQIRLVEYLRIIGHSPVNTRLPVLVPLPIARGTYLVQGQR